MNAKYLVIIMMSVALFTSSLLLWGTPQEKQLLFRTPNNNRIYVFNSQTKEEKILHESKEDIYFHDLQVSPTGKFVSAIQTRRGVTPPGAHDFSVLPRNSLILMTPERKQPMKLDEDVRKFSWSPDGQKIAYITGTYVEDSDIGFRTTGVGIFDLKERTKKQIKKDFPHRTLKDFEGGGYEIKWAKHDNNVYIRDFDYLDGIYRYNTKTGKSEKVDYRGINFSPDGKYYIEGVHLYLTSTNEDITSRLKQRFGTEWSRIALDWVFNEGHCLHLVKQEARQEEDGRWVYPAVHNVICDVEKDEILKEVTLPISRWKGSPDKLVFEKDGKIVVESYEDLCKE